jgi:hypothetical protein
VENNSQPTNQNKQTTLFESLVIEVAATNTDSGAHKDAIWLQK